MFAGRGFIASADRFLRPIDRPRLILVAARHVQHRQIVERVSSQHILLTTPGDIDQPARLQRLDKLIRVCQHSHVFGLHGGRSDWFSASEHNRNIGATVKANLCVYDGTESRNTYSAAIFPSRMMTTSKPV